MNKNIKKLIEGLFDDDLFDINDEIESNVDLSRTIIKYRPNDIYELQSLIIKRINEEGPDCNLNDIDTSKVTCMNSLFDTVQKRTNTKFNGDISEWDVSNVTSMTHMFEDCELFNGDLSSWNVSKVTNFDSMFNNCYSFNSDISNWHICTTKPVKMSNMFKYCKSFNLPIGKWNISSVIDLYNILYYCPSFDNDLSSWDITKENLIIGNVWPVKCFDNKLPVHILPADILRLIFLNKDFCEDRLMIDLDELEYNENPRVHGDYPPKLNTLFFTYELFDLLQIDPSWTNDQINDCINKFEETSGKSLETLIYLEGDDYTKYDEDEETYEQCEDLSLYDMNMPTIKNIYYIIKKHIQ